MKNPLRTVLSGLLCASLLAGGLTALPVPAGADDAGYAGTAVTHDAGTAPGYEVTPVTYTYDFNVPDVSYYAYDAAVSVKSPMGARIEDGRLTTQPGGTTGFGSAVGLGDNYGLSEGWLSFDVKMTGGTLALGLRTSVTGASPADRGIWLTFDGTAGVKVSDPETGISMNARMPSTLRKEEKTVTVHDEGDRITVLCADTPFLTILWEKGGHLAFCEADGTVKAETHDAKINPAGYFELCLTDMTGYIDNVVFTSADYVKKPVTAAPVDYSTWTATDALGRTVADNAAAGNPRDNRDVGLFYFLCWTGANFKVIDHTAQYLDLGIDGLKAYFDAGGGGEAYWAEPFFGYYLNTDTWVFRKHAYQLKAAGIDFIFIDATNGNVFIDGHTALFDTWLEMRREGTPTPQIMFYAGDGAGCTETDLRALLTSVYAEENWDKYSELFYMHDGKPLIFCVTDGVDPEIKAVLDEKFTVRQCNAWKDGNNAWPWMLEYRTAGRDRYTFAAGGWGRDADGNLESLAVSLGHHPSQSKGRSFVNIGNANNGLGDFEFSSVDRAGQGLCFEYEFNAMQYLMSQKIKDEDPFTLLITGWNEWIAGSFHYDKPESFANTQSKVVYVDQFNPEFSRDAEPMRNRDGYGFGDNYYYQLVDYVRRFKGINETPEADNQSTVDIYDPAAFDSISLTYRDHVGDTELRDEPTYDRSYRYVNNSGRNDLAAAKVSQDGNALYFSVSCAQPIVIDDGKTWMNLFLNVDNDPATGWNGYDYVLNRDRDSFACTVEKLTVTDGKVGAEPVGGAYYAVMGDTMTLRVSKSLLGLGAEAVSFIFKWADNAVDLDGSADIMDFMDTGDTAPDGRFGFRYICTACTTDADTADSFFNKADAAVRNAAAQTVTVRSVGRPTAAAASEIVTTQVTDVYDFSDDRANAALADSSLRELFEHEGGTPWSWAKVVSNADGAVMDVAGYSDVRTKSCITGAYEFSADVKFGADGNIAVGVRGELPRSVYYEWDWYIEKGGKNGTSSMGYSGIQLMPSANGFDLRVKRYEPDGQGVTSDLFEFPFPDGKTLDDWYNIRFTDDESSVTIYLDGGLLCRLTMEEPGTVYGEDGTNQPFFGSASVYAADGTLLGKVNKTRINSGGSQLFLASRDKTMQFTNLRLVFDRKVVTNTAAAAAYVTQETSVLADTRLAASLDFGVRPQTGTETDTEAGTSDTSAETGETAETADAADTGPAPGGCKSAWTFGIGLMWIPAAAMMLRKRRIQ